MASFQLSPAVTVKEEDLTNVIPAVATSIGAIVMDAQWGPVDEVRIIDSVDTLVETFGQPVTRNAKDWFCARNFLAYGKDLRVIRSAHEGYVDDGAAGPRGIANASNLQSAIVNHSWSFGSGPTTVTNRVYVKNSDDFDLQKQSFIVGVDAANPVVDTESTQHDGSAGANPLSILARHAGTKGNSISVSFADFTGFATWDHANLFDFGPDEDSGEFCMVVLDGTIVVERFFVSAIAGTINDEGQGIFVGTLINQSSSYIRVIEDNLLGGDQTAVAAAIAATTFAINSWDTSDNSAAQAITLIGGADNEYDTYTEFADNLQAGWDIFANDEEIDINLLITGSADANLGKYVIQNVAEVRKDCVAFVSPHEEDVVNVSTPTTLTVERRTGTGTATANNFNVSSSYGFMDGNYKYQYDPYNEVFRWIPLNGDMAGLAARTDNTNDPWWSFAGLNRGQIKNVVKFAYNPSKANRDELYKNSINPVLSFPGEGAVLFGDRTMLARPSAFRSINVRRLFIVLEKAIATASRFALFEFNDEFTRTRFVQQVEPFLRDVQSRRGILVDDGEDGFRVIADERVNTPEVINNNEFRARILIKPARSINFIELTFTAVNTGVDFDELIVAA